LTRSIVRDTVGDRIFMAFNYLVLTLLLVVILYPLLYVLGASFSSGQAIASGRFWLWPVDATLAGYQAIFKNRMVLVGFYNSLFYTVVGTLVNVVMTILAAYPLSRPELPGRRFIAFLFFFALLFSGGLIPTYLVVRDLGMLSTRWAMIIPTALSVWNVLIARTFFENNIPRELREAAELDGCDDFNFLGRIVLPLSGSILAVLALFYGVAHWNSYFNALVYLYDQRLWPLQLVLRDILVQNQIDPNMLVDAREMAAKAQLREVLKYSLIVVATVPLLLVYPFVQQHFVKGVMIGSVKG
jgi:putative aldouronate transport system permease protein